MERIFLFHVFYIGHLLINFLLGTRHFGGDEKNCEVLNPNVFLTAHTVTA